jgi:hypothetical protein
MGILDFLSEVWTESSCGYSEEEGSPRFSLRAMGSLPHLPFRYSFSQKYADGLSGDNGVYTPYRVQIIAVLFGYT